ncbi:MULTISPECIES: heme ABC transporter permease/ATP-binding protein CydD [Aliivibrio]|uniref:Cysteine/glutathione ABC transporter permease/ATP-binding protein CydD n=1 Tax=Aliivibrio finisterrensis TaxID=511998 RepID=A0A4Q5KNW8_9GAMM|nr:MULTISPECIES: cysteine/glutathione ABC transporter permease/ATP-binding protein CydD [Aliivibrio]MDD9180546.1 cysteine/glutathione ABC transporter permease/ATP-binding protein CydD [Aliivibrio sp. A6]RYU48240.1 cysteine/glutathione ABC transporter permease/ATP-binding protein CydD [Aliivibrio finisterrensis]RYU49047.1 cysteine/glutathione ABC transporter permease/ATP-binding protein CydD [Aliivibrio finisterrensis]RYU54224.1 cysteine/glutathione ABC transporter permease/ATP-binding protein C
MDKNQQRELGQWLKGQSKLAKKWLTLSIGLGFLSSLFLIAQAALLADILHQLIIEQVDKYELISHFIAILAIVAIRAACSWGREVAGYRCGEHIRVHIRQLILDKLQELGPAYIKGKPAGTWATLLLEQVEDMQDFFSRYLPQMSLSVLIPFVILIVVFPQNWAAGLVFLLTAPLVPLFMALVGMGAADANRRNFKALQRLSGHFYDRLQSMTTIRLFNKTKQETEHLHGASEIFRKRTMEVLRLAFLSSAVLEFFTSISIAIVAVYFGFTFIGELDFGHYGTTVTLFTGLFILILAPEFYQPLRDLGTFYHAKAQAIGAAESLVEFLNTDTNTQTNGDKKVSDSTTLDIQVTDLIVTTHDGKRLLGPISFHLLEASQTALVGPSGAGKTSLINAILGFLPYQGSIKINGTELSELNQKQWYQDINWVGQNPTLVHGTIEENMTLGKQGITQEQLDLASKQAFANEFIDELGYQHAISDRSGGLSVGQAQRLALARALLQQGRLWILDEPTASLDAKSERLVMKSLDEATQGLTTLMISHRLDQLHAMDTVLVMDKGQVVQSGSFDEIKDSGLFATMLAAKQPKQGDLDA